MSKSSASRRCQSNKKQGKQIMAISQSKYIRIGSSVNTTAFGSRDFSGLVFTKTTMASGAPTATKTAYNTNGEVVGLTSLSDVGLCFGTSSDEYKFAQKYFSYISDDGGSPSVLSFKKMATNDVPSEVLSAIGNQTNNFGSFTFLGDMSYTYTPSGGTATTVTSDAAISAAAAVNSGFDHRHMMCQGYAFTDSAAAVSKMTTLALSDVVGTFVFFGHDAYGAAIPMAMLASIDFTKADSTICFMFKQVPGEEASVTNDTDYEAMIAVNANFYGLTQTNGRMFAFLQRGFMTNGEDAGVYVNELWLKSAIATEFFNLVLRVNKIPANSDGAAMIRAVITPSVNTAISNGTILIGKTLTDAEIAGIYRYTKDEDAADTVVTNGYWLDVVIEKDGTDYVAKYYLVYAKGDGIRFCNGSHKLV